MKAPSGQDVAAAYTSLATILPELPKGWAAASVPTSGGVTTGQVGSYAIEFSRVLDSVLGPKGWAVPFPDISASDPRCPPMVQRLASCLLLSRVHGIVRGGNREQKGVLSYEKEYAESLKYLLDHPTALGYEQVSTPELLTKAIATDQYGQTLPNLYRLANRNIDGDSVVFCDSTGKEVFRPEGYPFSSDLGDYEVRDQAEGYLLLLNAPSILAAVGVGGGVKYRWSWRDFNFGKAHGVRFRGVSRL